MNQFKNQNLCTITYDAVRQSMQGEPYHMRLARGDANTIGRVINKGIDSHLEACFVPLRGDCYQWRDGFLHCVVSTESLPVLLRRLFEEGSEESMMLAGDMLTSLGFNESGKFVGER